MALQGLGILDIEPAGPPCSNAPVCVVVCVAIVAPSVASDVVVGVKVADGRISEEEKTRFLFFLFLDSSHRLTAWRVLKGSICPFRGGPPTGRRRVGHGGPG
jgi:hypothetical protein